MLIRGFKLLLDHFFDDFFLVDFPQCSQVSIFCVKQAFQLLGFELDPDKSQLPAEVAEILGVSFNTVSLQSQRRLLVQPKQGRKESFSLMVDRILSQDALPPSLAASLLGKFQFLCSTLFGKVGRFCAGYIRQRQYSTSDDVSLTPYLRLSLKLMKHILSVAPSRICNFGTSADVPSRHPRQIAAGVMIQQQPLARTTGGRCGIQDLGTSIG